MTQQRRKFTPEDRLSILQEGEREGHTKTLRKYQIAPSLYTRWKKKYLQEGINGLRDKHKRLDPEIRTLELENERLRRIIAKQALEIEVKSELLKKTPIVTKTR
ncbi:MAG: transposase [Bacteroidales bacterium]|mgnify:FL=1|nr:transposase [Bacteroidales bacterium]NMD03018.1 transposase [Bacteroidales bacterium]